MAHSLSTRALSTFMALHSIKNKIHRKKYFIQCLTIISHLSCSNYHPQSSNYIITGSQQVLTLHKIGSGHISCKQRYLFIFPVDAVGFHGLAIDSWRLSQSVIHSLSNNKKRDSTYKGSLLKCSVCWARSAFTHFHSFPSSARSGLSQLSLFKTNLSKSLCLLLFPPLTPL